MADEGSVAVAEAPVESAQDTSFVDDTASTSTATETAAPRTDETDKTDGRRQPDALRKQIADLRKQADSVTDPAEKARILQNAKELNNKVGKVAAYEQVFPTVRESKEVKALVDSFGGREGLSNLQTTLSTIQEVDQQLEAGDPRVVERMWKEAPEGMQKLAPVIFSELEKANPQAYEKAVVPHAVKFFDQSGFPEAFDQMVGLFKSGDKAGGEALAAKLAQWFSSQRQGVQRSTEQRVDPNVERLQRELDERKAGESREATNRAYNDVVAHAGPVIDKYLKPIVAKLGLSQQQYQALKEDTWSHLQTTRNADKTYQTVATAKYKQGMDQATAYIKGETEARAAEAAKSRANFWYGHQLKNGAVKTPNVTAPVTSPGITRGKEPAPSEIDYGPKGIQLAKKNGFKDLGDMLMAGKAPLKAGGIRQWR